MTYIEYYTDSRVKYADAFHHKIKSESELNIVASKLFRHFKLRPVPIHITSGRNMSRCSSFRIKINIDSGFNYGVLCHELSHLFQFQKPMKLKTWHNKEHDKIMKRMINYCIKKNWFENEILRRTIPRPRPNPDKKELKERELSKMQDKIIFYQKKIKFYENKLKKAKKSYSLKLSWIKRQNFAIRSPTIEDNSAVDTKSLPNNSSQSDLNRHRGIGV